MKSQDITIIDQFTETYKDVIDTFGGPQRMAEQFNWSISTVYKWLAGKTMGLTYAILITAKNPNFSLKSLIGYELKCEPVYLDVLRHFGSQTETANALGVAQVTVRAWIVQGSQISLEKALILEEVTKGVFHPSDFSHLSANAALPA